MRVYKTSHAAIAERNRAIRAARRNGDKLDVICLQFGVCKATASMVCKGIEPGKRSDRP